MDALGRLELGHVGNTAIRLKPSAPRDEKHLDRRPFVRAAPRQIGRFVTHVFQRAMPNPLWTARKIPALFTLNPRRPWRTACRRLATIRVRHRRHGRRRKRRSGGCRGPGAFSASRIPSGNRGWRNAVRMMWRWIKSAWRGRVRRMATSASRMDRSNSLSARINDTSMSGYSDRIPSAGASTAPSRTRPWSSPAPSFLAGFRDHRLGHGELAKISCAARKDLALGQDQPANMPMEQRHGEEGSQRRSGG